MPWISKSESRSSFRSNGIASQLPQRMHYVGCGWMLLQSPKSPHPQEAKRPPNFLRLKDHLPMGQLLGFEGIGFRVGA